MPWCIGRESAWLFPAVLVGVGFGWTFLAAVMHGILRYDTWRLGWNFSATNHDRNSCTAAYCAECDRRFWLVVMSVFFPVTLVAGAVHAIVKIGVTIGRGPRRDGGIPAARVVEKKK
jgi:hypothetical protein